jgi:hypothetical protein
VAKRETVADKLQRKLEEQRTAGTPEVTEDKPLAESDTLKTGADTAGLPETSDVSSGPEGPITGEETVGPEEDDKVFEQYDRPTVEQALADALKNPRVAAWSPTSAMMLNYFKSTRPRSGKSLSSEIDEILAEGLVKRYPELYQAFQIVISETSSSEITNLKGIKIQ